MTLIKFNRDRQVSFEIEAALELDKLTGATAAEANAIVDVLSTIELITVYETAEDPKTPRIESGFHWYAQNRSFAIFAVAVGALVEVSARFAACGRQLTISRITPRNGGSPDGGCPDGGAPSINQRDPLVYGSPEPCVARPGNSAAARLAFLASWLLNPGGRGPTGPKGPSANQQQIRCVGSHSYIARWLALIVGFISPTLRILFSKYVLRQTYQLRANLINPMKTVSYRVRAFLTAAKVSHERVRSLVNECEWSLSQQRIIEDSISDLDFRTLKRLGFFTDQFHSALPKYSSSQGLERVSLLWSSLNRADMDKSSAVAASWGSSEMGAHIVLSRLYRHANPTCDELIVLVGASLSRFRGEFGRDKPTFVRCVDVSPFSHGSDQLRDIRKTFAVKCFSRPVNTEQDSVASVANTVEFILKEDAVYLFANYFEAAAKRFAKGESREDCYSWNELKHIIRGQSNAVELGIVWSEYKKND